MRAVGLITEYNPFHLGHQYHLRQSLHVTGAQLSVAVMSGHFLQRGEPALADKWVRAEMALRAGVDLVVELPLPWACNSAPHFARGAVAVLESFGGGIEALCFGSEAGDLDVLRQADAVLQAHAGELACATRSRLRQGESFPRARAALVAQWGEHPELVEALNHPNNILGIEYLRALRESGSPIAPHSIARIGGGFHEREPGARGIASATAIRHKLRQGADVREFLPDSVVEPLLKALSAGATPDRERHLTLVLGRILQGRRALEQLYLVEDGIEKRLLEAAEECTDYEELVAAVKSRQFTRTRIERMLAHILLGVERDLMDECLAAGPLFLTLLGANRQGRRFLAHCRKDLQIPLIQNFSRVHAQLKRRYGPDSDSFKTSLRQLDLQLRASRLYTLLQKNSRSGPRGRDYYQSPCMLP